MVEKAMPEIKIIAYHAPVAAQDVVNIA